MVNTGTDASYGSVQGVYGPLPCECEWSLWRHEGYSQGLQNLGPRRVRGFCDSCITLKSGTFSWMGWKCYIFCKQIWAKCVWIYAVYIQMYYSVCIHTHTECVCFPQASENNVVHCCLSFPFLRLPKEIMTVASKWSELKHSPFKKTKSLQMSHWRAWKAHPQSKTLCLPIVPGFIASKDETAWGYPHTVIMQKSLIYNTLRVFWSGNTCKEANWSLDPALSVEFAWERV